MSTERIYTVLTLIMGESPHNFTPAWLDAASLKADSMCCNGCANLSELVWIAEHAKACAAWLRNEGVSEAHFVGAMRPNPFRRGQTVFIPAGSVVRRAGQRTVTKRGIRVKLHDAYAGSVMGDVVRNPELLWAGAGGLWAHLDLSASPMPTHCA